MKRIERERFIGTAGVNWLGEIFSGDYGADTNFEGWLKDCEGC
ncbi:hypothetical protein [Escherichia coli]|nr:hypothetical protein [Escherichia coli]